MLKSLIAKIRQVLYKMNLIKGIKSVSQVRDIAVSDEQYRQIEVWKQLYQGYYSEFHDIQYQTVNGKKERRMNSLNMPKVISQEMASLVFNEKCSINISDETLAANIETVFKVNNFQREFQRYLEYKFALGGIAIKGFVHGKDIKLSYVTADCFIPLSWSNKEVTEGIFVNEFFKSDKKYTHLEWHVWEGQTYVIRNELYESQNKESLGVKISLHSHFPELQEEVAINGLKRSLFVYIKPNTANNVDLNSPLGVSLYANALDTLKALDTAFDSFEREFRLGKKRILVPTNAIKTVVDPQTGTMQRYFDANDEVYEAFNFSEEMKQIQDIKVELRVEEHIAAINALLTHLAMQVGFSAGTFTFDSAGLKTATEVISENSKTFRTKTSHETTIEAGIQELINVVIEVAALYNIFPRPSKEYEVTVTFDDSITEDKTTNATYWTGLVINGLSSKKLAIMKIHGLTEEQAQKMLQEIQEENKTMLPEAVDLFGTSKPKEEDE
ncbi:phage portal protein [Ectobacillus sp. JY-23]|uniref:phage portal protein n=1 Tax=Ectobacillus sp. JY-23 TaxID=2933872 RepID=UPI001FF65021|nr:phage portal protein [Ectobacillus sp. JY-23]UOY92890.1 phage portal protein [Ectobacillus sp. JY-23]